MSELVRCNLLLDSYSYNPDTLDLHSDKAAKEYWFKCFQELVKKFARQAAKSQRNDPTALERAKHFEADYLSELAKLQELDSETTPLTIRTLLELNESCLRVYGFPDPWLEQKTLENTAAIKQIKKRLKELDTLESDAKWIEIFKGVLAGNMFDWGAQAISQILENDDDFGLYDALNRIQKRPWLIDGLDEWLQRTKGPTHLCAAIFTDNSGVDIVLGVLPLARELLLRNTKVILCANTEPALNDITINELKDVVEKCCDECEVIQNAYKTTKKLLLYGNGQTGPCLDFRTISSELCDALEENQTDLLIIEGMGRALHTNLHARFRCETLKLAVVKNEWLAKRLGGDTFSVICKYENI